MKYFFQLKDVLNTYKLCLIKCDVRMAIRTLLVCIIFLSGCITVDYNILSVPEEGLINFTRITENDDSVSSPSIKVRGKSLILYRPGKFFDVSKDGTKIAYIGWRNNKSNIFVKNIKGGRSKLQRTFREEVYDVSYSPDMKWLAFTDYRDNSWSIYIIGAESGTALRKITAGSSDESFPVFSPDGAWILFVQTEWQQVGEFSLQTIPRHYLWMCNLENGSLIQYTEGRCPSFTPDGKKIVFTRENRETGSDELWVLDLEKGQESLILSEAVFGSAAVSPNGKKLAIVKVTREKNIPPNLDIYLVNIDGTGLTQLTFHPGHDLCPCWSPDGSSLYFLSQRGSENGEYNIWRMELDEIMH
jgi:Tol biopolymer transport system component